MKIGKLYNCSEYSLLLYPTKENASNINPEISAVVRQPGAANYWSKKLNCNVSCINSNEIFVVLEKAKKYHKVLYKDKIGWIIWRDWLKKVIVQL